jgi:hypothetical protein
VLKPLKFLIYTEDIESFDELVFKMADFKFMKMMNVGIIQHFECFINNDGDFIVLSANVLFSEESCRFLVPKYLNHFNPKTQKWDKKLENFNFFENFNGCLLTFELPMDGLIYSDQLKQIHNAQSNELERPLFDMIADTHKLEGLMAELLKAMSARANFTFHISFIFRYQNTLETKTIPTRNFLSRLDFITLKTSSMDVRRMHFHWSEPINSMDFYYLLTPNDKYTNYEKLTMPFDKLTWIMMMITFGLSFGIIFGIHRCPQWIKTIVFGAGE